jgi:predicted transcriptional regulator
MKYKIALLRIGITQREAAKTLGFSESYISMLVSGQRSNNKFDKWLRENVSLEDFKEWFFNDSGWKHMVRFEEVCRLTGETKETVRRKCKSEKYTSILNAVESSRHIQCFYLHYRKMLKKNIILKT